PRPRGRWAALLARPGAPSRSRARPEVPEQDHGVAGPGPASVAARVAEALVDASAPPGVASRPSGGAQVPRLAVTLLSLALLAAPIASDPQPAVKVYRIGFLRPGQPPRSFIEAFQRGLRERGYVEGQNVSVEYRLREGDFDQLVGLAEELVRLKVDVVVASGGPAARAAQKATTIVPIIFVGAVDPVGQGLVASLAHPGRNVTGLSLIDLSGKRLEVFKELVPGLRRVAVLWERSNRGNEIQLKAAEAAARVLGLEVQSLPVQVPEDFESAFRAARKADALFLVDTPMFSNHRAELVALAAGSRQPASYAVRAIVEAGGLMS